MTCWCRSPGLWEQLSQDNSFVVGCASLAGLLMMAGTLCLLFGMAFTGVAVCVLYQTAVSLSIGAPFIWGKHTYKDRLWHAVLALESGEQGARL